MLKLTFILSLLPFISFSQTENSPDIVWNKCAKLYKQGKLDSIQTRIRYIKNPYKNIDSVKLFYVYIDTLKESNGGYSIGKIIIDYNFEFEALKIGEWKAYYPNGKLYSKGNYGIGAYNICSGQAPAVYGYSFRQNTWTYWYQNGKIMASGKFSLIPTYLKESIGLQKKVLSKINDKWKFYDDKGHQLKNYDTIAKAINNGG